MIWVFLTTLMTNNPLKVESMNKYGLNIVEEFTSNGSLIWEDKAIYKTKARRNEALFKLVLRQDLFIIKKEENLEELNERIRRTINCKRF